MVETEKSSTEIACSAPPASTSYRVIGADGFERDMTDLADWIVAIRSGAVEPQSLFLDRETLRWRPVAQLDIFVEAEQASATPARKMLVSIIASALLAGSVYMGLAPFVRHGDGAPKASSCGSCINPNVRPG